LAWRAEGKDKAKMAGGGGSDVQVADAAGAAGSARNGANGPGGPAGPTASVAIGDWGSRRAGSSAGRGRAMRGGDVHSGYPDEAADQAAEQSLLEGARPMHVRRTYLSPPSPGTCDAIPVISDDVLMDAETNNRRVALIRIQ